MVAAIEEEAKQMAVKLHRCSNIWVKVEGHPCWRVQKALDEQGIQYDIVKEPLRKTERDRVDAHAGPLRPLRALLGLEDAVPLRAVGEHQDRERLVARAPMQRPF